MATPGRRRAQQRLPLCAAVSRCRCQRMRSAACVSVGAESMVAALLLVRVLLCSGSGSRLVAWFARELCSLAVASWCEVFVVLCGSESVARVRRPGVC